MNLFIFNFPLVWPRASLFSSVVIVVVLQVVQVPLAYIDYNRRFHLGLSHTAKPGLVERLRPTPGTMRHTTARAWTAS